MMSDTSQIACNILESMLCTLRVHDAHQEHQIDLSLCSYLVAIATLTRFVPLQISPFTRHHSKVHSSGCIGGTSQMPISLWRTFFISSFVTLSARLHLQYQLFLATDQPNVVGSYLET